MFLPKHILDKLNTISILLNEYNGVQKTSKETLQFKKIKAEYYTLKKELRNPKLQNNNNDSHPSIFLKSFKFFTLQSLIKSKSTALPPQEQPSSMEKRIEENHKKVKDWIAAFKENQDDQQKPKATLLKALFSRK